MAKTQTEGIISMGNTENTNNNRYWLTSNAELAQGMPGGFDVTVEAEYGSVVVEGKKYTAAHHQADGEFSGFTQVPPCVNEDIPTLENGTVLLSHIDLDAIGGCLRTDANFRTKMFNQDTTMFWNMASYIDTNGPHKAHLFTGYTQELHQQLAAWWSWYYANVHTKYSLETLQASIVEVTDVIYASADVLENIFNNNPEYIEAGKSHLNADFELNRKTLMVRGDDNAPFHVYDFGNPGITVLFRLSEDGQFVNHLYNYPRIGELDTDTWTGWADAVITYNAALKSITLSYAGWEERNLIDYLGTARENVQKIWGPKAGGHPMIAGSVRDEPLTQDGVGALYQQLMDSYKERMENNEIPF